MPFHLCSTDGRLAAVRTSPWSCVRVTLLLLLAIGGLAAIPAATATADAPVVSQGCAEVNKAQYQANYQSYGVELLPFLAGDVIKVTTTGAIADGAQMTLTDFGAEAKQTAAPGTLSLEFPESRDYNVNWNIDSPNGADWTVACTPAGSQTAVNLTTSSTSTVGSVLLGFRYRFTSNVTSAAPGANGTPAVGVPVTITVPGTSVTCTGVTNAKGVATCTTKPLFLVLGNKKFQAKTGEAPGYIAGAVAIGFIRTL
jgi:hypothetical protein